MNNTTATPTKSATRPSTHPVFRQFSDTAKKFLDAQWEADTRPTQPVILCLCMRTELWLRNSGESCQEPAVGMWTLRLRADGTPIRIPVCADHAKGKTTYPLD